MRKLLEFIRSIYVMVLFVVLEAIAVSYYAHSTYYTQARLLARSNQVVGGVHGMFAGIRHYFSLGRENRDLLAHVAEMKERLAVYEEAETAARLDSYMQDVGISKYRVITASVASNTVNRAQNLVVVKMMPGLGPAAGSAFDGMEIPAIVGTVSGDDTVLVVLRDEQSAAEFCTELTAMIK